MIRYSREFVEYGFNVQLERQFFTESAKRMEDNFKGKNTQEVLSPIPLRNVYGWFVGLAVGYAAALVMFVWEHGQVYYRKVKAQQDYFNHMD
jgi:hypothetical protein